MYILTGTLYSKVNDVHQAQIKQGHVFICEATIARLQKKLTVVTATQDMKGNYVSDLQLTTTVGINNYQ